MKILVTGGAGYLGSSLTPLLLQAGHKVNVLDSLQFGGESLISAMNHPGFRLIKGDIRDAQALNEALDGAEAVVHLAAIVGDPACSKHPELAREINLDSSIELIRQAGKQNVSRFLFASTCSNYGCMKSTEEFASEDHGLQPVSLYAETKVAVEKHLLALQSPSMAATVLRFATLYGLSSRMRFDLTVNEFVMRLICEDTLTVFGEQFWRPYVHVVDAARAIGSVLGAPQEKVNGRVFNVGSTDENYRKLDLVELAKKRIPGAKVEFVHRTEDPRNYRVSFERIKNELGFEISQTVPAGIDQIAFALETNMFDNVKEPKFYNS